MAAEQKRVTQTCWNKTALIATSGAFICMFLGGIEQGWLIDPSHYDKIDKLMNFRNGSSWNCNFVSFLGNFTGALLATICLYNIGSRSTIISALSFRVFLWSYRLYDQETRGTAYILLRFSGETAHALTAGPLFVFLGEVLLPTCRGTLVSISTLGYPIGMIIFSIIFDYIYVKLLTAIFCLILTLITVIFFANLENTPYFLINKQDFEKAKLSIIAYFPGHDVEQKFNEIKVFTEDISIEQALRQKPIFERFKSILQELKKPVARQSLLLVFILSVFSSLNDAATISLYRTAILGRYKITFFSAKELTISTLVIGVLGFCLFVNQVDRSGRKLVFLFSVLGLCTSKFGLGIYIFFLNDAMKIKYLQWVPFVLINIKLISYLAGNLSAASIAVSELPPNSFKILAVFIFLVSVSATHNLLLEIFRVFLINVGLKISFIIQPLVSLLAIPTVVYYIPETKQKSLLEIQNYQKLRNRR